jgi:hypothetical protein
MLAVWDALTGFQLPTILSLFRVAGIAAMRGRGFRNVNSL